MTCRIRIVGYGDADPSNMSAKVRGAEMRVAATRAVNRALRKAYGIGICSVEELGGSRGNRPVRAERKGPCPAEPALSRRIMTGPEVGAGQGKTTLIRDLVAAIAHSSP
jgi:hypothetical protein